MTAATYSVEDPFILIAKKRPAADEDDQREASARRAPLNRRLSQGASKV